MRSQTVHVQYLAVYGQIPKWQTSRLAAIELQCWSLPITVCTVDLGPSSHDPGKMTFNEGVGSLRATHSFQKRILSLQDTTFSEKACI